MVLLSVDPLSQLCLASKVSREMIEVGKHGVRLKFATGWRPLYPELTGIQRMH